MNSGRHPKITSLEYLTCIYGDEWENFVNWLKKYLKENKARPSLPACLPVASCMRHGSNGIVYLGVPRCVHHWQYL